MRVNFVARTALAWVSAFAFGLTGGNYRHDLSGPEDSPEAIRTVLNAQQAAWNRGNVPMFLEGYWNSPELTFSGSEGIVRGYDGLLERYQRSYPDQQRMGELEFSGLEIRMLGRDSALVLGHWHLRRRIGDVEGVFTLVFRRFPVGWRIIHDHTSIQRAP